MSKHTAGPWKAIGAGVCDTKGALIAQVDTRTVRGALDYAETARLIAAAPDLLATLVDLLGKYTFQEQDDEMVRAVIAQVKGQSK